MLSEAIDRLIGGRHFSGDGRHFLSQPGFACFGGLVTVYVGRQSNRRRPIPRLWAGLVRPQSGPSYFHGLFRLSTAISWPKQLKQLMNNRPADTSRTRLPQSAGYSVRARRLRYSRRSGRLRAGRAALSRTAIQCCFAQRGHCCASGRPAGLQYARLGLWRIRPARAGAGRLQ